MHRAPLLCRRRPLRDRHPRAGNLLHSAAAAGSPPARCAQPCCTPLPAHLPPDYRESGNTGAVLVIAPSLDFEFVCFPPTPRRDGSVAAAAAAGAAGAAGQAEAAEQQPEAPLPDGTGVSLPPGPLAPSPFAAQAEVPLGAAPARGDGGTPAAQTMQQARRLGAVPCVGSGSQACTACWLPPARSRLPPPAPTCAASPVAPACRKRRRSGR